MQRPHGSPAARFALLSCMAVTLLLPVAVPVAARAAGLALVSTGLAQEAHRAAALTSTVAVSAPALLPTVSGISPVSSTALALTASVSATSMATGPLRDAEIDTCPGPSLVRSQQ